MIAADGGKNTLYAPISVGELHSATRAAIENWSVAPANSSAM